jgi:glycosyltransferase involved in cell wall biosynthesis
MTCPSPESLSYLGATGRDRPSILYLIDSLAPGGAERSLVEMAPYLIAGGIDLSVAVLHDRAGLAGQLEEHNVPVAVVGRRGRVSWLIGVASLLRQRRPDLVHTTLFDSDIVGRTAAALRRIPVVSTLANTTYGPEHFAEGGVSKLKLGGAQIADAVSARLVCRFHAVSQSVADTCAARLRLPRARIEVIPRGRDVARMGRASADRRHEVRGRLGIPLNAVLVLAVARQERQKGLDVLVKAFPIVTRRFPDAMLVVAGREGRATADLQRIRTEIAVEPYVHFLGERADVADLLCAADAFVLPSRREGLPGSVLEAMAMGAPVVASDLPTVREAVPDDRFAVLVRPEDPLALGNALASVLADRPGAIRRALAARTRFEEQFDIAAVGRAMVSFYRRALFASPGAVT